MAAAARRRVMLLALAALVVVMHTATTRLLRSTSLLATTRGAESRVEEHQHDKKCYDERDYGMIAAIRQDVRTMCDNATGVDAALGALSTYRVYRSDRASLQSALVTNLWVDLRNAEVFKQISDLSQDGHLHDPRFKQSSVEAYCVCNAHQDQSLKNGERVWGSIHGDASWDEKADWSFCKAIESPTQVAEMQSGFSATPWNKTLRDHTSSGTGAGLQPPDVRGWPFPVHHIKRNALIVARRDDHNPFFQISVALNAWIMMKALDWTPETTQLVYFDDGLPAITDELQRRVLTPVHPVVKGRDIMGSMVHFDNAMVVPFEYSGPMMRHLDDDEPCRENALIKDFRALTMDKYGVSSEKRDPASCTITVITRRPYRGRMVQRKWLNEDTILDRMREDYGASSGLYKYGTCQFQSLEFVDLTLDQQMRVIVESDLVIGMHGAGMVNVLWARPETRVVEIFPEHRHRWGFRNLCLFLGCKWSQFRGGKDTGTGDNTSDKLISYGDWFTFFDPIIRETVAELEARVAKTTWR